MNTWNSRLVMEKVLTTLRMLSKIKPTSSPESLIVKVLEGLYVGSKEPTPISWNILKEQALEFSTHSELASLKSDVYSWFSLAEQHHIPSLLVILKAETLAGHIKSINTNQSLQNRITDLESSITGPSYFTRTQKC